MLRMTQYVAFLRGINVGGKNPVRMTDLCGWISAIGMKNVQTYIQCGNVLFESRKRDRKRLARQIERKLLNEAGNPIMVTVRSAADIDAMITSDPFKRTKSRRTRLWVTLLMDEPQHERSLPYQTDGKELKILQIQGQNVFSIGYPRPNGWYAIPNILIEKEFGVYGTTRGWLTLKKLHKLLKR
jgi:uncharacterized protein (DUF1697 family)